MDQNIYRNGKDNISEFGMPCDAPCSYGDYEEISSFSSEDIKNIMDQNRDFLDFDVRRENENFDICYKGEEVSLKSVCEDFDMNKGVYNLQINIKHSEENSFDIANNLILDGCQSKYGYNMNSFMVDDTHFYPNFNIKGIFEDIYARLSDRILKFSLCKGDDSLSEEDPKADTSYGFKLSQIIDNLGNIDEINKEKEIISINEHGDITLYQKALVYKKGLNRFIIFKFNIKNIGNYVAKKLLFKDILPQNVKLLEGGVFLNEKRIDEKLLDIDGRRVLVKVDELYPSNELNLIIVGVLCDEGSSLNAGVLSYVSGYTEENGIRRLNINQVMSNIKSLKEKGCN